MICPFCKKEAKWCDNVERYGKRYGKSYMCYWCEPCDAYVGCHNNTQKALGTMANQDLRSRRMLAHSVLDPLWKSGKYNRHQVYSILKKHFGYEVHVGSSNEEQCDKIIKFIKSLP